MDRSKQPSFSLGYRPFLDGIRGGPLRRVGAVLRQRRRIATCILLFGFTVFLCVRLYRLIDAYAVNIFFYDQWALSFILLAHPGQPSFFLSMGTWYHGVGAIVTDIVYDLSGWNARTEGFTIYWLVVLTMLTAFWLKVKLFGPLNLGDAIIPVIFMTPTQFESFWGTIFIAHAALPILLVLVYCLCWLLERSSRKYAAIVVTNFLATFTGNGFVLGTLTPPLLVLDAYLARRAGRRRESIAALVGVMASVLTLLSWWLPERHFFIVFSCFKFPHDPVVDYVRFVSHMFRTFLGFRGQTGSLAVAAGFSCLGLLLAICLDQARRLVRQDGSANNRHWVILILAGYCLAFCFWCAAGRVCVGMAGAEVSRYMTFLTLGFLAIYYAAVSIANVNMRNGVLGLYFVALMLGAYPITAADRVLMEWTRNTKKNWKECYLRLESVDQCNAQTQAPVLPPASAGMAYFTWQLGELKKRRLGLYADVGPAAK